jgi:hypothetical protein
MIVSWLTVFRYKPDIEVDWLAQQLAFDGEDERECSSACAQFICDYGGKNLFEDREGSIRFVSGKAGNIFEVAKQSAFAGVDIKGQI